MKYAQYAILIGIAVSLVGCTSKYPPDWPKTYPCTITVTKGGEPYKDVTVLLARTANHGSWAVSGLTDSSGDAVIETSWTKASTKGAPEGTFTVTLSVATPPIEISIPQEQLEAMPYDRRTAFIEAETAKQRQKSMLPPALADPARAKVQIEVQPGTPATLTIEVDDYR